MNKEIKKSCERCLHKETCRIYFNICRSGYLALPVRGDGTFTTDRFKKELLELIGNWCAYYMTLDIGMKSDEDDQLSSDKQGKEQNG